MKHKYPKLEEQSTKEEACFSFLDTKLRLTKLCDLRRPTPPPSCPTHCLWPLSTHLLSYSLFVTLVHPPSRPICCLWPLSTPLPPSCPTCCLWLPSTPSCPTRCFWPATTPPIMSYSLLVTPVHLPPSCPTRCLWPLSTPLWSYSLFVTPVYPPIMFVTPVHPTSCPIRCFKTFEMIFPDLFMSTEKCF